ncbi:MAG TPA: carbohydrate kinase [Nitriliruptoraceae bacterium]|nr:carbohydrate kinase [Nitriliruptoraceae bacterium]
MAQPAPDHGSVAVFGEALVDMIPTGEVTFEARAGGSPANIAVATARLGCATTFLGGLSTDRWGHLLAAHLEDAGVTTTAAPRSDRPTAMAFVDLATDGSATYRFLWDDTADRAVVIEDLPSDLGTATWVQVGSVSAALPDTFEVAHALALRERGSRLVSCDPNVRTMVHGDDPEVRARLLSIMATADLVKSSDEDLEFLYGPIAASEAIRRLLDGGAGVVAVTRGGAGALLASSAGTEVIEPVAVTTADTVGAGDTFMAALLAGFCAIGVGTRDDLHDLDSVSLRAVGRLAATAASITVGRVGADPPTLADLPTDVLLG